MRITLSILTLFFYTALSAQFNSNWLPVKINHKLGFIDNTGSVIVEPKYDAVGERPVPWNRFFAGDSNFRLVELDKKLGLIDQRNGIEVLAPNYTQIRPLHDTLFVVTYDSMFTVVNRVGKILIDARYEDIRPIYDGGGQVHEYFMVKKDELWGVHKKEGPQIFPPKFGYIELIDKGKGYFKVKEDYKARKWGLFSGDAMRILPDKFDKIDVLNDNFILGLNQDREGRGGKWTTWNHRGEQVLEEDWYSYKNLNKHFVTLKNSDRTWYLYAFSKKDFLSHAKKYDFFHRLNKDYIIAERNHLKGILDSLGNEVLPPTYKEIEKATAPFFKVRKKKWGLITLEEGIVVPCEYQAISNFDGMNALVRKNDYYGMINIEGEEVIPAKFEDIQKEENYYKGFVGTTMTLYEMSDSGKVINEEFFPEVYTLNVGYELNMFGDEFTMSDIRRNANARLFGGLRGNRIWSPRDTLEVENTPWIWQKNEMNKRWGCFNSVTKTMQYSPQYQTIRHIPEVRLTMVYSSNDYILNRLSSMVTFPIDSASSVALFCHDRGKFITSFNLMGLNRQDFRKGRKYARFIDKEGQFGLIDRTGKQILDENGAEKRFTYIGDFRNGKARACLGGKITVTSEPKDQKISPDWINTFVYDYWITPTRFFALNHRKKFFIDKVGKNKPKWGYIDTLGNFVIDTIFNFANDFQDSMAINQIGEFWGVINEKEEVLLDFKYAGINNFNNNTWKVSVRNQKPIFFNNKGHEIIGLKYSKFGGFSDGMCAVMVDSLWGFVDESGFEVIPCQYKEVKKFSEGWAAVRFDSSSWFFIDKKNNKVLEFEGELAYADGFGAFNSGLCWYQLGRWYGYINKKGKTKIEAVFTKAFDFQHNVARVVYEKKTGLINTKGKWILKPQRFEVIFSFDENGLAEVREHYKKPSGLMNAKGELLTTLKYRSIEPFNNGYYRVSDGELWGFLNAKGKEVIPTIYAQTSEISNDLVAVRHPSQLTWYYINSKNQRAFKGNFEIAEAFSENYVFTQKHEYDDDTKIWLDRKGQAFNPVPTDDIIHYSENAFGMFNQFGVRNNFRRLNYYYCDKNGINLFNRFFEDIQPFKNKTAPVRSQNKWGVINDTGVFVIEPKYSKINHLDNGLIHVKPSLLFGLASRQGEIIIPAAYDYLEVANQIYRVERGEQIGYLDRNGNWIWEIQN